MPHLFRWMFSFGFSTICDHLIKSKTMSITNVRKLATFFCKKFFDHFPIFTEFNYSQLIFNITFRIGNILQGIFILGLCFFNCNSMVSIIMLISATAVNGAVSSGALAAVVDLAPNYAGKLSKQLCAKHIARLSVCAFGSPIMCNCVNQCCTNISF